MVRIQEIQRAMAHLVGWRQAFNPSHYVDDAFTHSETGLYFQDAHPMLTLENIASIMPDGREVGYSVWLDDVQYAKGEKVFHNRVLYRARRKNIGVEPTPGDFNGDYNRDYGNPDWEVYNPLSDYLSELTDAGIAQVVQQFITDKQLTKETRSLLERRTFFDGAGRLKAMLQNTGRLVGFEITPVRSMGVTMKIEKVGLQMFGGQGFVCLYLFHSSQPTPIKTFKVYLNATNGMFQWFDLKDCYLPYISSNNNAGGSWYLCYNQNDLPRGMEAINMTKDWSKEPCGTCTGYSNIEAWREITKYMQVSPCSHAAPDGFCDNPQLWDIAETNYTNTINYGLNCEVSVACDLTDFIISQRQIFATVLQRQVAYNALRTLALNPNVRVNRNQANATRNDLLYELDGNVQTRRNGLGYELEKAYQALSLDTRNLDRVCLQCNNHGVKYRNAF